MRTLVLSDLHFGTHAQSDVLRDPERRAPLIAELADCQRLVLLGDLLELRHGPLREALAAAREPLSDIGKALGPDAEVVILAGNHDHHLVEPWLGRRSMNGAAPSLGLESAVEWTDGEPLAVLAEMLAPARVRSAYPGVWLRSDVWATHGHYLDLHMTVPTIERIGTGVMRRVVGTPAAGPANAEDYEAVLAPLYLWLHGVAQGAEPGRGRSLQAGSVRGWRALSGPASRRAVRGRAMAAAWPVAVAALNGAGLGPLRPDVSGPALRRSGLRAMSEVARRLGVPADHVIFGHTHRAGPLPGDDVSEWSTSGAVRLINSGSWVTEPAFLGADAGSSPYRTGFAVAIDGDDPPRLINLLDPA